jgi:hypothetical protein
MRRFPTCRLPSPDKKEPDLVAENKSRPLMPLLPMAQVRAYLPATGYRRSRHNVLTTLYTCSCTAAAARRYRQVLGEPP